MVRTEEFRPGNYILLGSDTSTLFKVEEIDLTKEKSFRIKAVLGGQESWHAPSATDLLPAILDEDWLINFGFKKEVYQEDRSSYIDINFVLLLGDNKSIHLNKAENHYELVKRDVEKFSKVKYVHKLQNLYEDMTGRKLEKKG
jgi:hypothetical protein